MNKSKITAGLALLALVCSLLTGCAAPLLLGGAAVGGALVATDRRTSGAQVEDEAIELKAMNRIAETLGDRGHINTVSYNRQVLITGEVPNERDKALVQQVVSRVDGVASIINEIGVMPTSSLTQRASDSLTTGRVKAAFVDAKDLYANSFKVFTERGVTYLMGRVTQREASRATEIARGTTGVQKIVRIFEIVSEDELLRMLPQPAKPDAQPAKK
jgi:osmotically-inducible protein OsmY